MKIKVVKSGSEKRQNVAEKYKKKQLILYTIRAGVGSPLSDQ